MVHVIYDVTAPVHFFALPQTGSGAVQVGEGPYFEGLRFQRGYGRPMSGRGVLGVLSKFWRVLKPFAKKHIAPIATEAMHALTEEGIGAGKKILQNIESGANPKEAIVTEGTTALRNLVKRAGTRMTQAGSGRRRKPAGSKRKQATKRRGARSIANLHLVGRSVLDSAIKKNRRKQTLGLY